jgi:Cu(I)/Ag(I) efflux system membrane protein CusA/SilA
VTDLVQSLDIRRYGMTVGDVQDVFMSAIGGKMISTTIEGLERYSANLRYPRELRDNIDTLKGVLVANEKGQQVPLGPGVSQDRLWA